MRRMHSHYIVDCSKPFGLLVDASGFAVLGPCLVQWDERGWELSWRDGIDGTQVSEGLSRVDVVKLTIQHYYEVRAIFQNATI